MNINEEKRLNKYLFLILRHKFEIINIKLDNHGWEILYYENI